jgi:hypothetical protein
MGNRILSLALIYLSLGYLMMLFICRGYTLLNEMEIASWVGA